MKQFLLLVTIAACAFSALAKPSGSMLAGKITDTDGQPLDFVTVYLKGTPYSTQSDERGVYHLAAPEGRYTAVFHQVGFEPKESVVKITEGERTTLKVKLHSTTHLSELTVTANPLSKMRNSAYNATAVDTRKLAHTSRNLSDALDKAPGMKMRLTGGEGSDAAVTMDGFSGRHVKVFIDGVPQEGAGNSFNISNIPAGYADRIEVYRGVVPVAFGTDALGGVVNIVTKRQPRRVWADASYTYGSFNTHKSAVNFGQGFSSGFRYELSAFQNYSDNDYTVYAPVEDFSTGALNRKKLEKVRRFNDRFHNEAVTLRAGWRDKAWADRLIFSATGSKMYKEIQTGVRQAIVYGQKHRHGFTLSPTVEYSKRDLFTRGLSLTASAAYNRTQTVNVDTASVKYNWRGETAPLSSPGEQSRQNLRSENDNWNATATASYRLGRMHDFTLSNTYNAFTRNTVDLLTFPHKRAEIAKETAKNIAGLSYRIAPVEGVNVTLFGKQYNQWVAGPVATTAAQDTYTRSSRSISSTGYGAAATWFLPAGFQLKGSYEKAYRLPTIEEMFGDEDLEVGAMTLRPENSRNTNLSLSYTLTRGRHSLFAEGGAVVRDTRDYIQRNILALSGGKSAATYVNYGRVSTLGYTLSAHYNYSRWLSVGGNLSQMNVRDNMPLAPDGGRNVAYRERMPNLPYLFADTDVTLHWHGLGGRRNTLSVMYDNRYTKEFCYYASNLGTNASEYMVPTQWEHNASVSYAVREGKYVVTLECRNLTDARLYDNFSLQKPGRAVYAKIKVGI